MSLCSGVLDRPGAVLNFCANNYLGLSNHPAVVASAKAALDSHGFGLSSVRFICGTQVAGGAAVCLGGSTPGGGGCSRRVGVGGVHEGEGGGRVKARLNPDDTSDRVH